MATPATSTKVWFIRGASHSFLRAWAEAALKRVDKVATTMRQVESIAGLNETYGENVLTLEQDMTRPGQEKIAVEQACTHFSRLDVVLNNVGYSLVGTSAEDIRAMICRLYGTKRQLAVTYNTPANFSSLKILKYWF